ncbi:hypothetical protein [Capnocytophaga gingivalis]
MNKENYPTWLVPLDIAKELKEIGFDKECIFTNSYLTENICFEIECNDDYYLSFSDLSLQKNTENNLATIPTWEQVFEWFRERGYYGNLKATNKGTSAYIFYPKLDNGEFWEFDYKESYEEARKTLLLKLIDLYKTANQ